MADVYVCTKCKQHRCISDVVTDKTSARVHLVGCQKVCKAPVVGLAVNGRMEWFGRVDRPKALAGLVRLVKHDGRDALPKVLAKRRSGKRSGRPPR
jgi:hypothetical protein